MSDIHWNEATRGWHMQVAHAGMHERVGRPAENHVLKEFLLEPACA